MRDIDSISISDLRTRSGAVRQRLREERELVVTARGRPVALLIGAEGQDIEELLSAVPRARAMLAIAGLRAAAAEHGLDRMTPEEIDAEIAAARAQVGVQQRPRHLLFSAGDVTTAIVLRLGRAGRRRFLRRMTGEGSHGVLPAMVPPVIRPTSP